MMFEFAELEHRVGKAAYRREEPKLREGRNRKQWANYEAAVCDMVDRTSRIKVLRTLCNALESAVDKL